MNQSNLIIFENWKLKNIPKCICPQNKQFSVISLSKKQRNLVLKINGFKNYSSYLQSSLWASIRKQVLENAVCVCGCRKQANQVHHKTYTEANLMGINLQGLVPINQNCHYSIEFSEKRKTSLGKANRELKQLQFKSVAALDPPTENEIKTFLAGKQRKMDSERLLVVKSYLKNKGK